MDLELIEAVGEYILAKIELTECMQKHLRQVCQNCKKYPFCKIYEDYIEKWIILQKTYSNKLE